MFNLPNLEYVAWLTLPLLWGLVPGYLTPLIGAIPALAMNLLATSATQKNLTQQYSLPIVPFAIVAVIAALAAGKTGLKAGNKPIVWSLIGFLALAKFGYFGSLYLERLDTWQATREAIQLITTKGPVLTVNHIAPHLTHRLAIALATAENGGNLGEFDYILLDRRHPGWASSPEVIGNFQAQLQALPQFQRVYEADGILLFARNT